ncbi:hypothetical protein MTO96_033692 [Rhipicephalus appendiculatus]
MSVALEQVDLVLTKLEEMGTNAEAEFHKIFSLCQDRAAEFGVKCEIPRVVGTQKYRANYDCSSAEEYYRRALFIPYIDDLKASLKRRFANHRKTQQSLQFVLPKHASKGKFESVQPAFDFYLRDMTTTHILTLKGEWEIWKTKWQAMQEDEFPRFATDALAECDKALFPNIHTLLKILAMLPVSTAAAERSFSTLKRVKTYLRNRTAEERLNGLALMSIHRIQCETRFKTISRRKRNEDSNNRTSGQSRCNVSYEEEFAAIRAIDDSLEPEVLRGVGKVTYKRVHAAADNSNPSKQSREFNVESTDQDVRMSSNATRATGRPERPRNRRQSMDRMKHMKIFFDEMYKINEEREARKEERERRREEARAQRHRDILQAHADYVKAIKELGEGTVNE